MVLSSLSKPFLLSPSFGDFWTHPKRCGGGTHQRSMGNVKVELLLRQGRPDDARREEKRREERALFFGWCVDIFLPRFDILLRWIKQSKSLFCSQSPKVVPEKVKNFERWRCDKTEGGGKKEEILLEEKGGERGKKKPSIEGNPLQKKIRNGITIIDGNSIKKC